MTKDSAMKLARATSVLLASALLASACSSSSGDDDIAGEPVVTSEPTTTVATPSSTTEPNTITSDPIDPAGASEAWIAMWDGVEMVVTDPDTAEDVISAVASAPVFDQLNTIYNPSVDSDVGNSPRIFENNPVIEVTGPGSVTINDCMFETPKLGNATIWYSGTLTDVDGQWQVQSVNLEAEIGCVPTALAEAAIDGYEDYWDAREVFWDPADPTSSLLTETMTGVHLELIEGLLVDHANRGLALRGRAATHPEVIEVRSATEVAILDCGEQDTGRGLFVVASGERLSDIALVREGQRDLTSAVMVLEGGVWKVSDVQGQADVSCDIAPTIQGLPLV